jgi:cellulose synthase/poly-beta-1,6-N-acetylglucosamine synthase-like glycosyltransferase
LWTFAAPRDRLHIMADNSFYIARVHAGNTSRKHTSGTWWKPRDPAPLLALIMQTASAAVPGPRQRQRSRSNLDPKMPRRAPDPGLPTVAGVPSTITIGVHAREKAERLEVTLQALAATGTAAEIAVLAEGPDLHAKQELAQSFCVRYVELSASGAAAAFNHLVQLDAAQICILLEDGARPAPRWLDTLTAPFMDPEVGLAGPSTNRHWTQQAVFPRTGDTLREAEWAGREAWNRFGTQQISLGDLHGLGDFCYAVRREVIAALGAADETFGGGPCWEMEYSVRAARAGFRAVWAAGSYVHRAPEGEVRRAAEAELFAAAKVRFQDRLCGLRLSGARTLYAAHCRGDACPHFAPSNEIEIVRSFDAEAARLAEPRRPVARASDQPLVSCMMPTGGRREFALQAIRYFDRQSWPSKELLILDDGTEALEPDLPCDPRIRYVRTPRGLSIGAKRNQACALAAGEVVMFWDDDDWFGPDRITRQAAPLLAGEAEVSALRNSFFLDLQEGSFWQASEAQHRRMFQLDVHGGTVAFQRKLFERGHRFPNTSLAEDAAFLTAAVRRGARLATIPAEDLYVYVRHGANTWRFGLGGAEGGPSWIRCKAPASIKADLEFYGAYATAALKSA